MRLIGDLKKKVENAETKEEARDTIKKAGMQLTDDELDLVAGGVREEFGWVFQEGEDFPWVGTGRTP